MLTVTISEQSARQSQGFYAPSVELSVRGAGLPESVVLDVSRVVYRDCVQSIDACDVTLTNWDDDKMVFKYIGSETSGNVQGGSELARRHQILEPGDKTVELRMGYVNDLALMMRGTFTTVQPHFSSTGPSTINARCLNVLHQLRRRPHTSMWRDLRDSEIAEQIATMTDEDGNKRFPMPIRVDEEAKGHEEAVPFVAQDNQYDIDFLHTRAKRLGYVLTIDESGPQPELYFGPSQSRDGATPHAIEWGKEITSFHPTLSTANQVRAVTVKGWNRDTQQPISERVDLSDTRITINRDLHRMIDAAPREEQIVHEPVFTAREARERALNLLLDRQRNLVQASVTTVGLPQIRAGRRVRIVGVGCRLSGTYFVTDSTHTFDASSGYTTAFEARREDQGEGR